MDLPAQLDFSSWKKHFFAYLSLSVRIWVLNCWQVSTPPHDCLHKPISAALPDCFSQEFLNTYLKKETVLCNFQFNPKYSTAAALVNFVYMLTFHTDTSMLGCQYVSHQLKKGKDDTRKLFPIYYVAIFYISAARLWKRANQQWMYSLLCCFVYYISIPSSFYHEV